MSTYMLDTAGRGELEPANRVRVLYDDDHDGTFDRATTFLDGLVLPRAVAPCFGGALVIEPPMLYFCPDVDRDGIADDKLPLLDGFAGLDNPEHAGNSLVRGIDNWYHIAQHPLEFRFDGQSIQTRPAPLIGQWGQTMDDAGRLYTTPNSNPLLVDLIPRHYAARNPAAPFAEGLGIEISQGIEVFPAVPTPGVNRGYQPGFLRDDGTLKFPTAACSPLILRTDTLGPALRGDALACESAAHAVMRLTIAFASDGSARASKATPPGTEFLRSTDERFRPVGLVQDPDGSVLVLDMYRGLIQHRTYLTEHLATQVRDRHLDRPTSLGRIYRVSGPGYPAPPGRSWVDRRSAPTRPPAQTSGLGGTGVPPVRSLVSRSRERSDPPRATDHGSARSVLLEPSTVPVDSSLRATNLALEVRAPAPHLSSASPPELVALLLHPDGWWRDTAQRLLIERADAAKHSGTAPDWIATIAPPLRDQALTASDWRARAHALWTLDGLRALPREVVLAALADPSAIVRAHAARLAETLGDDTEVVDRLRALADDPDRWTRVQAVLSMGARTNATTDLVAILRNKGSDKAIRAAALSGLAGREAAALAALLADKSWPAATERGTARALVEAALGSTADARAELADIVGRLAMARDVRAGPMVDWMWTALGIVGDSPTVIALSREPGRWLDAVEAEVPPRALSARMKEVAEYWDWPDRPVPEGRKSAARAMTSEEESRYRVGEGLYATCAGCHQASGRGSLGIAPPLAGSAIVNGPVSRLALVLADGLGGPYVMAGTEFRGVMAPAPTRGDGDLAALMTYIRRSWGNTGDPVTASEVSAARQRSRGRAWTREELEGVR